MEVSYSTMIAAGNLVKRLAQNARRLEKALAETMNTSAEWKRIADELKAERNAAKQEAVSARQDAVKRAEADRVRIERLREERDQFRAKLEAATGADHTVPAAVPQHGVIGKTVRHSTGRVGRVMSVKTDWVDGHGWTLYAVQRSDGVAGSQIWHASNCTIVEERPAEGALPQLGDVVRLVRVPTLKEYPHDSGCWEPNWGGIDDHMRVHYVGSNITGIRVVRAVFGLEWPVSCVEVVKGADK